MAASIARHWEVVVESCQFVAQEEEKAEDRWVARGVWGERGWDVVEV